MSASAQRRLYGGIEAGGTKFLCTVSHGHDHGFLARAQFRYRLEPRRIAAAGRRLVP
ncbi:MAG UNVERIFIED_CONTAM: hypothetical protein LVR18_28945 [Planctomycetaceae bacterium]